MKYQDPKMEEYFNSLPVQVRSFINRSGADICSPGELTMIGEHLKHSLSTEEPESKQ
ncbi:hypothetical protein KQI82_08450 [Oscillibacter sp. MSJ-2]|uniref:Uncharacterized protein n=1 Tax=Dysosmobacter acutus TaxID=2841504 RepID=A0ABS6FBA4_9FIRM|nr:hypothetical protein [Dysosmobacter acutus]MBU5626936.1 hypothetical protein [Dysosmobacter acutus]